MFDFSFIISSNPINFSPCKTHHNYLNGVNYNNRQLKGKNWECEYFYHRDLPNDGYANVDGIHCFLLGNAQKNNQFAANHSIDTIDLSAESLIDLYLELGPELIKSIKGTFLMVICDDINNRVVAFSSKSGMYRLYFKHINNTLYLSSSLAALIQNLDSEPDYDYVALLQHGFFQYPLGSRTFFKGISTLDNYCYLYYDLQTLESKEYFKFHELLNSGHKLSRREALEQITDHFVQAMKALLPDDQAVNAALTGGYDSRCILAYILNKKYSNYRLYTWSADKRWGDALVADLIAQQLSLKYDLIELGREMLDSYPEYCDKLVYWTDGTGSINRANQMYSHTMLAKYSRKLISGYFGSELFRPMHKSNVMIDPVLTELIFSQDRSEFLELIWNQKTEHAFQQRFLDKHKEDFFESSLSYMNSLDLCEAKHLNFFHYIVKTGFWKFFGQEIHAQRINTQLTTPYMDDDFLCFLALSELLEVHKSTYKRQGLDAFKGQSAYHPILKNLCPTLMSFTTNRGFAPQDFSSPLYPINVILKHQYSKRRQKKSEVKGFDAKSWNQSFFEQRKQILGFYDETFRTVDINKTTSGFWYSLKWYLSLPA